MQLLSSVWVWWRRQVASWRRTSGRSTSAACARRPPDPWVERTPLCRGGAP